MKGDAVRRFFVFTPGDVVVFTLARTRRQMEALAKRKPEDSWSRAARRILRRLDRNGLRVSDVARELRRGR
jgi:hypothetical protein